MNYQEFRKTEEHIIVRNSIIFNFRKITENETLIQISIATLPERKEEILTHEWVEATRIVTDIEAYYAYENILNGGLK